jgi:hypothetical protein
MDVRTNGRKDYAALRVRVHRLGRGYNLFCCDSNNVDVVATSLEEFNDLPVQKALAKANNNTQIAKILNMLLNNK